MNKKPDGDPFPHTSSNLRPLETNPQAPTQEHPQTIAAKHAIAKYLQSHSVRLDMATQNWLHVHEVYTHRELANRVWVDNPRLQPSFLCVVIEDLATRLRAAHVAEVTARLITPPDMLTQKNALRELEQFIQLIAHESSDSDRIAYYVAAFRQLIWQVKRKLRGLQSHWDVMVVLVGAQGSGKSTAVARFARPLDLLYMSDADFDIFSDSFRIGALSKYYLICFDEMGRASKADMERVKNRITATTVQARAMRTEQERNMRRNASFIGTTNFSITDSINDVSGMRRFVEVKCRDALYNKEWGAELRAINFDLLWQVESGLDDDSPLNSVGELVQRYRSETQTLSSFDYFWDTHIEQTNEDGDLLSLKSIYARYSAFERSEDRRPLSSQKLAKKIEVKVGEGIRPQNLRHWRGVKLRPEEPAEGI